MSRSSAEAQYKALAITTSEIIWLQQLLQDFGIKSSTPALLFCDNQDAIHLASNPMFHERKKHIEIDCHFVLDKVAIGSVKLLTIRSQHQIVDVFTKPLPASMLLSLLTMSFKDIDHPS